MVPTQIRWSRASQLRWLQVALEAGIPLEYFLIVEWF